MIAMMLLAKRTELLLLIVILFIGFVFRIWGLGSAEIFHDEGLYAFRSIGYVDYLQNEDQSTPIQWFKDSAVVPWWTKLSFHDAPPLFFFVQHLFFRVFGNSLFVARFPSLIAGMLAIWLVYLIGRMLWKFQFDRGVVFAAPCEPDRGEHEEFFSRKISVRCRNNAEGELIGLFAALLLSVNHIHIWISRTSIMESLLITLMLANIYFFLRWRENDVSWIWFGLTLGLVFLTKYTGIVLLPLYGVYCLLFHRQVFKDWRLYAALGIALVLFSPVLIYNFYLYSASGHFDLQIAYALGQKTPEWRASLGKIQEPFAVFIPNMLAMYSKPFLVAVMAGVFAAVFFLVRAQQKEQRKYHLFLFSGIVFVTLLLTKIGVAFRFLTLYLPFAVVLVASVFVNFISNHASQETLSKKLLMRRYTSSFFIIFFIFVIWEIWFSISGIFIEFPRLGVVELDRYLSEEMGSARSSALVKSPNSHLNAVIQRYSNKLPKGDAPTLIVYDENTVISPKLWLFTRRLFYEGIPAITVGQFNSMIGQQGPEYFKSYKMYFIKANENSVMINTNLFYSHDAKNLEDFLKKEFNLSPLKTIYGFQPSGQGFQQIPTFYVYKILF